MIKVTAWILTRKSTHTSHASLGKLWRSLNLRLSFYSLFITLAVPFPSYQMQMHHFLRSTYKTACLFIHSYSLVFSHPLLCPGAATELSIWQHLLSQKWQSYLKFYFIYREMGIEKQNTIEIGKVYPER